MNGSHKVGSPLQHYNVWSDFSEGSAGCGTSNITSWQSSFISCIAAHFLIVTSTVNIVKNSSLRKITAIPLYDVTHKDLGV